MTSTAPANLIAEAIRDHFQTDSVKAALPEKVEAAKRFFPSFLPRALITPKIVIAPRAHTRRVISRRNRDCERDHVIQIGILALCRKVNGQINDDRVAELIDLVDHIEDELIGNEFYGAWLIDSLAASPLYDEDHLDVKDVFRATLSGTWRLVG